MFIQEKFDAIKSFIYSYSYQFLFNITGQQVSDLQTDFHQSMLISLIEICV